jgi:sortase A
MAFDAIMSESTEDHPASEALGGPFPNLLRRFDLYAGAEWFMKTAGLSLLVLCTISILNSWIYQASAGFGLGIERLLGSASSASTAPKVYFKGQSLGWIEIPRLGILAVVAHGDDSGTLSRAVGHIPGTAFPGQGGNVGLAGHRDTFFRALEDIRGDDSILLVMPERVYEYRVDFASIVRPERVDVLESTATSTLTLVTCYPFEYIGLAPYRYVIRATERRIEPEVREALLPGLARAR